jgi:ribose/xylose/arabinose/galactoside ABC-type transport system permease subunit
MKVKVSRELLHNWFLWIFLLLFWAFCSILSPFFRTLSNFSSIIITATPIALVALGQTYVVLTGEFDLSVGAIASLATAIASVIMEFNLVLAIISVLVVAMVIGLVNGLSVTKLRLPSFIVTLAMMFIITGIALIIRPSPGGYISEEFKEIMLFHLQGFPITTFFVLVFIGIFGELILQGTGFGRHIYATGGSGHTANLMGVKTNKVKTIVFMVSAICAATGGLFVAARYGSGNATAGAPYLFDSFTAVFMGGTLVTGGIGNYKNSLAAALLISSLTTILQFMQVNIWYQYVIKGLLLLGVAGGQLLIIKEQGYRFERA